jgi:hypothetical protein
MKKIIPIVKTTLMTLAVIASIVVIGWLVLNYIETFVMTLVALTLAVCIAGIWREFYNMFREDDEPDFTNEIL